MRARLAYRHAKRHAFQRKFAAVTLFAPSSEGPIALTAAVVSSLAPEARMASAREKPLRSRLWFDDPRNPKMTALYLERYLNYGLTRAELQSSRPIIGIAQTGSDLVPCNRHLLQLAERIKDGVRDAGGVPLEFGVHALQETGKRPTAALDRNLAYLGLVEILYGYPLDGVVLTTGCDKTTPACLGAAITVNIPAIVLSGGPMLNGHYKGKLAGSGTVIWEARRLLATGEIDYREFMDMAAASAPSAGHCNTMGTASSMNALAEALGMSLTGCAAIPAPYRERAQMAYDTGFRIVGMVEEDLAPLRILTRAAFENSIRVAAAIGASTNSPVHINWLARQAGIELSDEAWNELGHEIPLLVNCMPAGEYLGEDFYRAGGVPAVMGELLHADKLDPEPLTVSGQRIGEAIRGKRPTDRQVIRAYDEPLAKDAGMLMLSGNLFDSAVMKTSVISPEFRRAYLSDPADPDAFVARAIVFDGPEDYAERINDPAIDIDERCILVMRNVGPIGFPGAAEVVNMQPPDRLIARGVRELPTLGDGRQSGTSASPSILNASPEAAAGGGLALLKTGDSIRVDLGRKRVDLLVSDEELESRKRNRRPATWVDETPWQEIYRRLVGGLSQGACLEFALKYRDVVAAHEAPRHSH
jgi:dihydroxy-acid dehydratase